jgi:hypothetical protein
MTLVGGSTYRICITELGHNHSHITLKPKVVPYLLPAKCIFRQTFENPHLFFVPQITVLTSLLRRNAKLPSVVDPRPHILVEKPSHR